MSRNLRNLIAFLVVIAFMSWPVLVCAGSRWTTSQAYRYCLANHLDPQATSAVFLAWYGPDTGKAIATLHFQGDVTSHSVAILKVGSQYMAIDPTCDDVAYDTAPQKAAKNLYPNVIKVDLISFSQVKAKFPYLANFHDD